MQNQGEKVPNRRIPVKTGHPCRLLAILIMLPMLLQTACFFKKHKPPVISLSSVRIAFLPFNVPADKPELRWFSTAGPVLLAKASKLNPDLIVVPLWETMPPAIEAAGASRTFTTDSALSVGNWLAADWVTLGDITSTKSGVHLYIDFLPVKGSQIPFRYLKNRKADMLGPCFPEAFTQFLRYLMVKIPVQPETNEQKITLFRPLAEALDKEYGWSATAEPGKAQEYVSELLSTDERLARILFNPSVYPEAAQPK